MTITSTAVVSYTDQFIRNVYHCVIHGPFNFALLYACTIRPLCTINTKFKPSTGGGGRHHLKSSRDYSLSTSTLFTEHVPNESLLANQLANES